jgi:hypothetical protein
LVETGPRTIAQLASKGEFWAVQNLVRRGVVTDDEASSLHQGKNVVAWAEQYEQLRLVQELCYFFRVRL